MFTIHGQLTEQDYLRAQQLHMQLTGWVRFIPYATTGIWVVGVIFALIKAIQGQPIFFMTMLPTAFIVLAIPLSTRLLLSRQIKRIFRQNKEVSAPLEMTFSDEGMKLTNSFGHSERSWSDFVKWKEDEHGLLLCHSDQMFNLVPKRLLSDAHALSFVREQLQSHHVPVAGTPSQILMTRLLLFMLVLFSVVFAVMSGQR